MADTALVAMGGLAATGLIVVLGWGEQGGWRLIASAALGLAVAMGACELPACLALGKQRVPADVSPEPGGEPHGRCEEESAATAGTGHERR